MFTLKKKITFEAAHMLPNHDGACKRLHGHSWVAWVEVSGQDLHENGPKSGMLADFGDIKFAVEHLRQNYLDHHYLNDTLHLENPTSEEISRWLYNRLKPVLPQMSAVTVEETCTSACRYDEVSKC